MQENRYTLTADFAIEGRLAYLSHQETLTMFQRALVRAGLPLAYSGGFNPRPRLSLPLARSVGIQSGVERLCVGLLSAEPVDAAAAGEALGAQLPAGCRIVAAQCVDGKRVYQPATVQYALTLTEAPTTAHRQQLAAAQAALAAGEPIAIQRYRAKKRKWETFDLSPFVEQLAVSADRLTVTCRVSPAGTVRVDELMQWLAVTPAMLREPVRRTAITWQADPDNNLKESNQQCPEKC